MTTHPARDLAAAPFKFLAGRAAQAYVAGPELSDALDIAGRLARSGASSTLCYWNSLEDSPAHLADRYCEILRALGEARLDSYLSIKAPGLKFDLGLIRGIVEVSQSFGIRVHFDALEWSAADLTFSLLEQLRPRYSRLSCTLPGRWRRSLEDAAHARDLDLDVRVIKGQWPDPSEPDVDMRKGFLAVVDALAGTRRTIGVATHDPPLAAESVRKLRASNTPCELELLYGLPDGGVLRRTRSFGVPLRYYIPFGHAWLPYALRQAFRSPHIFWWVVRDALTPHAHSAGDQTSANQTT